MKELNSVAILMMGMCMQTCCMCAISCAKVSDMFSILKANFCTT